MKYQNRAIEYFCIPIRINIKRLEQFRVIANNTGVGAKTGFDIFLGDICSEDAETRTGLVKKKS